MIALALLLALPAGAVEPSEAVEAWLEGDAERSAALGRALLDEGAVNADVYYNLGNALFRQGALPEATLAWRRAALLAPRDGDIEANLHHARRAGQDHIEPALEPGLFFWRRSLSVAEQGYAAALLIGLTGLLGLSTRRWPQAPLAIPAALALVPGLLLALSTAVSLRELATRPGAVVLVERVEARSGGRSGLVLFELHGGAEVELWERVGDQAQVALPDGRRGWVPLEALGVVDPAAPFPR